MRKLLIAFSLIVLSAWTISARHKDVLGVEGPLTFNGVQFELSEVEKLDSVTTIQTYKSKDNGEYIETLQIQLIEQTDSAREKVAEKVLELAERKAYDFFCDYDVMEAPNGKEFILNYREVFQNIDKPAKVNFNCSHYSSTMLSDGAPAVVIYGYYRNYLTDDIDGTVSEIDGITQSCLNAMMMDQKPTIAKK